MKSVQQPTSDIQNPVLDGEASSGIGWGTVREMLKQARAWGKRQIVKPQWRHHDAIFGKRTERVKAPKFNFRKAQQHGDQGKPARKFRVHSADPWSEL